MADSTTNAVNSESLDVNRDTFLLKTSEVVPVNRPVAYNVSTGALENMDTGDNLQPVGLGRGDVNGNSSNTTGDGAIKHVIECGVVRKSMTVTGVSSAADKGKLVWATDNNTFTLTRQDAGLPIGIVKEWVSSTTCHVQIFSYEGSHLFAYMGTEKYVHHLASVPSSALEGTSAIDLSTQTMYGHGKITDFYCVVNSKDSGAVAGAQVFNLEIGGTDVTGGALTLDKDDTQGAAVAATAITAANEFHDGDVLQLEMQASGTGFTADKLSMFSFYAEIERKHGA